jgi:hypothetical protein
LRYLDIRTFSSLPSGNRHAPNDVKDDDHGTFLFVLDQAPIVYYGKPNRNNGIWPSAGASQRARSGSAASPVSPGVRFADAAIAPEGACVGANRAAQKKDMRSVKQPLSSSAARRITHRP